MKPLLMAFTLLCAIGAGFAAEPPLQIGSKKFTESVLLAEITTTLLNSSGIEAVHVRELGGSRLLWNALLSGDLDAYPEYTGTLRYELLANNSQLQAGMALAEVLNSQGISATAPIGFNNTYAIGILESLAEQKQITRVSDLRKHPELRLGFSNEFMERADGWPGLQNRYRLKNPAVGLDHDLAYRGLVAGDLQGMDLYATDAEIDYYQIRVLEDDLSYFPEYQAVILYRSSLQQTNPAAVQAIARMGGSLHQQAMIRLNAQAKLERIPSFNIAASFAEENFDLLVEASNTGLWNRLWTRTMEQLLLVVSSLAMAIVIAMPLGILAARHRTAGHLILGVASIAQTIPALALLVFMIPLFGIGTAPAIAALFLYSLLPIIRNTEAGLKGVSPALVESAKALGMTYRQRLRLIELPLARGPIMAGIKTAAVINIGTATLGALVGAGGYGQPILTGIRLDDIYLIMEGALPAALMALLVQGLFELAEKIIAPHRTD